MWNEIMLATLRCLFELAREDRPAQLQLVAAELGLSCRQTDAVLRALERAGLADAPRIRLTMAGLALAVSLPEGHHRKTATNWRAPRAA